MKHPSPTSTILRYLLLLFSDPVFLAYSTTQRLRTDFQSSGRLNVVHNCPSKWEHGTSSSFSPRTSSILLLHKPMKGNVIISIGRFGWNVVKLGCKVDWIYKDWVTKNDNETNTIYEFPTSFSSTPSSTNHSIRKLLTGSCVCCVHAFISFPLIKEILDFIL